MSLADELLADLDGLDNEEVDTKAEFEDADGVDANLRDVKMEDGDERQMEEFENLLIKVSPVLQQVAAAPTIPRSSVVGNIEDDPEYRLIVQANSLSVDIDEEILSINKYIRNMYATRFEELDSLIVNPLDYARAVRAIGNEVESRHFDLSGLVPKETMMVIAISATTTKGVKLEDEALQKINRACDLIFELDAARKAIMGFVQTRMNLFAPNTTAIVGSTTTAQLIGVAGGLRSLANYVSCNLPALGAKRATQTGLSIRVGDRQQGFLFYCELVQQAPPDLRRKVMRVVAGKVVLAARMDVEHSFSDGSRGRAWRDHCEGQIERLTEPAPNTATKALPAPVDKPSKRRGGKRARREKEKWAMTELRKAQNRMAFGKEERTMDVGDESVGLGMIGQETGRVRALAVDNRTKAKLSKNNLGFKTPHKGTSGFESSLAFTPVQGLELVEPSTAKKRKADEDRWFSTGTFSMVEKKSKIEGSFEIRKPK